MSGIKMVYDAFKEDGRLPLAQRRMAVAVKMVVNKVYHTKNNDLFKYLISKLEQLFSDKIITKTLLPWKTRWRLWWMQH